MTTITRTVLFVALLAAPASAQRKPAPAPEQTAYAPAKTIINITDDDVVEGEFVRPGDEIIKSKQRARMPSLIKLRVDFIPEMRKSVEDL